MSKVTELNINEIELVSGGVVLGYSTLIIGAAVVVAFGAFVRYLQSPKKSENDACMSLCMEVCMNVSEYEKADEKVDDPIRVR